MNTVWPWLAMAGLGALHGLNPATGWMLATGWALRTGDRTRTWRALLPIALGHIASIALAAIAIPLSLSLVRFVPTLLAGGLIVAVAFTHCSRRKRVVAPVANAGLALWSFLMASTQGAGVMLVPALLPLCTHSPGRDLAGPSPVDLALAAAAVHTAAMLLTAGIVASGAWRSLDAFRAGFVRSRAWPFHS